MGRTNAATRVSRKVRSSILIINRNRHLFSLIQLAKETNNNELAERLHSFLDSTDLSINQKVRTEEILFRIFIWIQSLDANQGDETSIIHSIRTIAKTDRYITDASIIQALQHFCETYVSDLLFM